MRPRSGQTVIRYGSPMKESKKTPPPVIAENDRVLLWYAWLDGSVGYTEGHGLFFVGGKEIGRVPCLAICEEKLSGKPTLYYCDENWKMLGVAANYESIEAAKRSAELIYPGVATRWVESHFTDKDADRHLAATASLRRRRISFISVRHRRRFDRPTARKVQLVFVERLRRDPVLQQTRGSRSVCDGGSHSNFLVSNANFRSEGNRHTGV